MSSTYVIAEAGVNHNGSRKLAMDLIDVAAEAGADAVKFQTFDAKSLVTHKAMLAPYQKEGGITVASQLELLANLELSRQDFKDLKKHAEGKNIEFLSTAFDSASLYFLSNELSLTKFKIPSGEITNGPFLLEYARTGGDLILSTGMSSLREVETALSVLAFGLIDKQNNPSPASFEKAFHSSEGKEILRKKVTVLHCTSEYPAPVADLNLLAIKTLLEHFKIDIGFSDHSQGIMAAPVAVALGAKVIEKHFTLDKSLPGPDHKASLDPEQLKAMIRDIRFVENALGSGIKEARVSELKNIELVRRSIVARKRIGPEDFFSAENLTFKRPGTGVSPMKYWSFLGLKSRKEYQEDDLIEY